MKMWLLENQNNVLTEVVPIPVISKKEKTTVLLLEFLTCSEFNGMNLIKLNRIMFTVGYEFCVKYNCLFLSRLFISGPGLLIFMNINETSSVLRLPFG